MNKSKNIIGLMLFVYIATVILTVVMLVQVPKSYMKEQVASYDLVKELLAKNLATDTASRNEAFAEVKRQFPVEFIIYDQTNEQFIYQTLPIQKPEELDGLLNEKAVSRDEVYETDINGTSYFIWLAQYNMSPQTVVNKWLFILIFLVILLFTVMSAMLIFITLRMMRPLKRLRDNVYKMSSYQLDKINSGNSLTLEEQNEQDALSYELSIFSKDLLEKIEHAEVVYTSLEKELQLQNEVSDYKTELLATLIHDLKTPLHTAQLQIERVQHKNVIDDPEAKDALTMAYDKVLRLKDDVNDLIKVSFQDKFEKLKEVETFNIVELLYTVYDLFQDEIAEKEFMIDFDTDAEVFITGNRIRIKQLMHNAFSNICRYGHQQGEVKFTCYRDANRVLLKFYNDAELLSQENLDSIFKLFYRVDATNEGTGVGMYAMKQIMLENHGDILFKNREHGVELICVFID